MILTDLKAWVVRTPLKQTVEWTVGGREAVAEHLWLQVTGDDGRTGISEIPVKPFWTGCDGDIAIRMVERMLAPRSIGKTPAEALKATALLRGQNYLLAALGNALADLAAPAPEMTKSLAVVLTRNEPAFMTEAVGRVRDLLGVSAIKIKVGAGLKTDTEAISAVRKALGPDGILTIDANGAYSIEDGLELCRIGAGQGVVFVEDPFPLTPDRHIGEAISRAAAPVCADRILDYASLAEGMLEAGAGYLATKTNRIGPEGAAAVADAAERHGAGTVSALFGDGQVGAAQIVRNDRSSLPVEAGFFLELDNPVSLSGVAITDGRITIPAGRLSGLIDMDSLNAQAHLTWETGHG
jgi:L-alanine-DL-glutamate epimerase-like enolase superfamily enzyme